ncbi:MAG TPA: SH3 domain-containing protein [Burkholderiales bacterium]|nr:SH3 domain-containing protein [Burkholderiales bacterium]
MIFRKMHFCLLAPLLFAVPLQAAEFRSVVENVAVLYDAPSLKARQLYLLGRDYPLEVVVKLENWIKVRDATGELAWVEKKYLSEKRTVLVTAQLADIRQAPEDNSPPVFQAEQSVLLELLEFSAPGWIRVRHRDGQTGYVRISQVWGG